MIEIAVLVESIAVYAQSAKKIIEFAEALKKLLNAEVQSALLKSARIEMEAAHDNLEYISYENPREAVNRALGHLESAYGLYKEAVQKYSYQEDKYWLKLDEICFMIAACHKQLGSTPELVKHWLVELSSHYNFRPVLKSCIDDSCLRNLLTKEQYNVYMENYRKEMEKIAREEEIREEQHETSASHVVFESWLGNYAD